MERIFLSFSFRPNDEPTENLVSYCEHLLAACDLVLNIGDVLEGQPLTPAVTDLIDRSDALIAILSPRDAIAGGRFHPSMWVRDELTYARAKGKPALAVVFSGVDLGGAWAENERVDYDPAAPIAALTKISRTLKAWKRRHGRRVKVRLLPPQLEPEIGNVASIKRCMFRLTQEVTGDELAGWRTATTRLEPGGAFAFLDGVTSDAIIELQIEFAASGTWNSRATPQWLHIELSKQGAA